MRKIIYLLLLFFLVFACRTLTDVVDERYQPVTVNAFLDHPFGDSESVAALKKRFSKEVKIKRIIRRNKHDAQKVDTIFQFYYRKSSVFVYKTYFNREMIFGGVIYNNKFPLVNGVVPGMKRSEFFKSFKDLDATSADSMSLDSKEQTRKFTFIFDSKGKLKKINFSLYVD